MSTSFTIGFAKGKDLETFSGVLAGADGYTSSVIPTFLWISKTGRFSDLVKAIKSAKTQARMMNSFDDILKGKPMFDFYPEGKRAEGRDDFFTASYSYLIHDKNKITYYTESSDPGRTINVDNIVDWEIIYRKVFEKLFNLQSYEMRNPLFMALYQIEAFKKIKQKKGL